MTRQIRAFSKNLDTIATQHLKRKTSPLPLDIVNRWVAYEILTLMEALLIYPEGVTCKNWGENVVLAILVNKLGVSNVVDLLKMNKLNFSLWTHDILAFDQKSFEGARGVYPLAAGGPFGPECYNQPACSAEKGLERCSRPLSRRDRRRIISNAARRTTPHPHDISDRTIAVVKDAHASGGLVAHGLMPETHYSEFIYPQVKVLLSVATAAMEFAAVGELGADYFVLGERPAQVSSSPENSVKSILSLEGLPDFRSMIVMGEIGLEQIAEIVARPETRAFQQWLWDQPDPSDVEAVSEQYVGELTGLETRRLKPYLTRTARVTGVGALGAIAGAVLGSFIDGALAAGVASGGAGVALSLADEFWINKLVHGHPPHRFISDVVRPRVVGSRAQQK
jgi:hypothetical protein